jgi:signal transduction histidine kinase/CheY-like chemotaxis protein
VSFRQPLFRKYLLVLTGMIAATLIIASVVQTALSVRAQRARVDELLMAQSQLAIVQIQSFLSSITDSMLWALDYDQPGRPVDLAGVRDVIHRLLRKVPSLLQLRYVSADGCVRIEVARVSVDSSDGCASIPLLEHERTLLREARHRPVAYGRVLFRDGSEPYVDIAIASRSRLGGALLAQVDLRQIHSTVTAIRAGASGSAYIVDQDWQLIAHPDANLVLRHLDLRASDAVAAVLSGGLATSPTMTYDFNGNTVLSVAAPVRGPRWWLFVQQPAREAFHPILESLGATLFVVLVALVAAVAVSYLLARRMSSPILAVRVGAERIGAGDLQTRIVIETGDEVELLAHEFNRMAIALGESHEHLEAKVSQRTAALELVGAKVRRQAAELAAVNAELSSRLGELALRKDEAERASAAKTRFLAAASHDLMQPMHAVGLLLGVLYERLHNPDESNLVSKIQAAVHGMESLFSGLLDISKLDSHTVTLDMQTIELEDLFAFVELNYQPLAQEKNLSLRFARCRYGVRSDSALLERIVANLVSNAIRYTVAGKVLIGCRRVGNTVRLQVHDTGVGIAAALQGHIFEEFDQIDTQRCELRQGLGLGLSIVQRSAALLGVAIHLTSTPGRGSMFEITLPLAHRQAAAVSPVPGLNTQRLRGAFIVVVDDDVNALYAMEQLFGLVGCHVIAARSTAEIHDLLSCHIRIPDLIVTDLRLGGADSGLHAIDYIRRDSEQSIAAIIVTGESNPPSQASLPDHCMLLRKPVRPASLFNACIAMLGISNPETPVPAYLLQ